MRMPILKKMIEKRHSVAAVGRGDQLAFIEASIKHHDDHLKRSINLLSDELLKKELSSIVLNEQSDLILNQVLEHQKSPTLLHCNAIK